MTGEALSLAQRRVTFGAIYAGALAAGVAIGMLVPLVSLILEARGSSSTLIGAVAAAPSLAVLVVGPLIPRIIQSLGTIQAIFLGTFASIAGILLMPVLDHPAAWLVLRFLQGMAILLPWIATETWVNLVATPANRGRIIAVYAMCLYLGFALGPLLVQSTGIEGWPPFLICAAVMALVALPFLAARRYAPAVVAHRGFGLISAVRAAPTAFAAAFVGGFAELAMWAILPVYALQFGMDRAEALTLLTAFVLGGVALQLPLGWISDRMDRRVVLLVCAAVGLVCMALLPTAITAAPWNFVLLVVLGSVLLGLYALGLGLLGERFAPGQLAAANTVFVVLYDLGGLSGPPLSGAGQDMLAPHGMVLVVSISLLGFVVVGGFRHLRSRRGGKG